MQKELSLAVAAASAAIFLASCGDENTTNVTETSGVAVIAAGDSLPACDEENVGKIVFAEDSAQVYYCADGKWTTLKGEQDEAGSDGSNCTVTPVDNGIEVRCDGEVVGVIANGKDGTDGEEGSDGKGCTAEAIENGYKILCGGDSIGVLKNGEKGEAGENGSGCEIADQGDGVVEVTCGEGENASTATLYKAMCGAAAYDPATQICADDSIYVCSESLDGEKIAVNGISYQCWEQKWIEEKENWQYLNPAISYEMFKDARDGQIYKSVKIGNQVWMAENLNYDYNEGTAKSYCYNDEQESCAKYGRLYTWAAAMDSAGVFGDGGKGCGFLVTCSATEPVRGVCPESWHLPSDAEWQTLFAAVGGTIVAGTKLKSKSGWDYDGNGTDEYGFSGMPAGNRDREGLYNDAGKGARFWSSTERGSFPAYLWIFSYGNKTVSSGYHDKFFGYSIRCIKD